MPDRIVNLCPHTIVVRQEERVSFHFPSGQVARCAVTSIQVGTVDGVPVMRTTFGPAEGLPDPEPDTYFLVSRLVAEAARERTDLLIPNDTIRDATGSITGCRSFACLGGDDDDPGL